MAEYIGDGRVKAKDKRTGDIVREHPHVIERSKYLDYAPSAKPKPAPTQVTEPARPVEKKEGK